VAAVCSPARPSAPATLAVGLVVLATLLTTAVPGCSRTATTVGSPAPVGALNWQACGPVRCATLVVPVDGADPAAGSVTLALVEQPAADPSRRVGTLLVNPGGPGASGNAMVRNGFGGGGLADQFDVVSWDPRGVGQSGQLACSDGADDQFRHLDSAPDDPDEQQALDDAARAVADRCEQSDAVMLRHMSTAAVADDVERIRVALGEDRLEFLFFSYGTLIGQLYAETHPDRVRAMVLDGVVDPTDDLAATLTGQTTAMQHSLDQLFATCTTATACPIADPAHALDTLAQTVEQVPLADGRGGNLGPSELALATLSASYTPGAGNDFLQGLADAQRGDGRRLATLASAYESGGELGEYLGVSCTDAPHPDGNGFRQLDDRLAAISPRLGPAIGNEMLPCAYWHAPVTGTPGELHAQGSGPILVIGNTGDAATPEVNAEHVATMLGPGHLVTYDGRGHTSYFQSTCVAQLVNTFLVDLTIPPDGQRCS
jgi:pimeloyl-ACP methyl ester carboxylesterase